MDTEGLKESRSDAKSQTSTIVERKQVAAEGRHAEEDNDGGQRRKRRVSPAKCGPSSTGRRVWEVRQQKSAERDRDDIEDSGMWEGPNVHTMCEGTCVDWAGWNKLEDGAMV